jgi:hypothetical protein
MSILKAFGAAAMLIATSFTLASAQAVIQEPGYCAFFYPTANCQKGPGNPYSDPNWRRDGSGWSAGQWPSAFEVAQEYAIGSPGR